MEDLFGSGEAEEAKKDVAASAAETKKSNTAG